MNAETTKLKRNFVHCFVIGVALIAALIVFGFLMSLPGMVGFDRLLADLWREPIRSPSDDWPLLVLISIYSFFQLIFPFWASNRFLRFVLRIASRRLYASPRTPGTP